MAVKDFVRRSMAFLMRCLSGAACLFCVICLLCVMYLPVDALAAGLMDALEAGPVDTDQKGSITVKYDFSDASFRLYRVADISETADFTPAGDFASYAVDFADQDSSGWRSLAETLAGYVQRDGLKPLCSGSTDQEGNLLLSELDTGLYLLLGEIYEKDGVTCTPMPVLISLPGPNENHGWTYDVILKVKYDSKVNPSEETLTERKVIKVWKDEGQESRRPEEISVQLLCNGEVYDTVRLNADNDWRYTWNQLYENCQWQVVEKEVPEGYTVSTSCEGSTFILTNTCSTPDTPSGGNTASGKKTSRLPYTGMLWAPVPFLALSGMLLFLIGWFLHRKQGKKI